MAPRTRNRQKKKYMTFVQSDSIIMSRLSIDDPNFLNGQGEVTFLAVTTRGKQHNL
jgi:hypothetical protein